MAFAVTQIGGDYRPSNYREFLVDTVDDLASLPNTSVIAAGSVAYCSGDGNTYILETDNDWAVKGGGSSGDGGSDGSSGGSGVMVVTLTKDMTTNTISINKTVSEIASAYQSGVAVSFYIQYVSADDTLQVTELHLSSLYYNPSDEDDSSLNLMTPAVVDVTGVRYDQYWVDKYGVGEDTTKYPG